MDLEAADADTLAHYLLGALTNFKWHPTCWGCGGQSRATANHNGTQNGAAYWCIHFALIMLWLTEMQGGRGAGCTVKFNSGDECVSVLVMHTSAMPLVRAVWQGGGRLISLHSVWWYLLSLPSSGIFMNFTVAVQLKVQFLLSKKMKMNCPQLVLSF